MIKSYAALWSVKVSALAASLLLTGCSTTAYAPQFLDTPMPAYTGVHLCGKNKLDQLERLQPGQKCLALVRASAWLTHLPIAVKDKQVYTFAIPGEQFWYDASERIVPPETGAAPLFKRIVNGWKRLPDSGWFALVAAVVPLDRRSGAELQQQEVGPSRPLSTTSSGQLALYPNDAVGPPWYRHFFYNNNHGQIWVLIARQ